VRRLRQGQAVIEDFIAKAVDGIFNDMLDHNLIPTSLKKPKTRYPDVNGDAGLMKGVTNVTSTISSFSRIHNICLTDRRTERELLASLGRTHES